MTELMNRLRSALVPLSQLAVSNWAFGLIIAAILAPHMVPEGWSSNEINYYDLAYRWVNPDVFGPYHAVFDNSISRVLSFAIIGSAINAFGFENAEILLGFMALGILSAAYVSVSRAVNADLFSAAIALILFLMTSQSLIGDEWLFEGVEPKTLAYMCTFFGLSLALQNKRIVAIFLLGAAVYFHFLIGAFWGAAALGLFVLRDRAILSVWRPALLFAALSAPLVVAVGLERAGGAALDFSGVDLSLNQIYAEFRNAHHVAPFVDFKHFFTDWFPGFVMHGGFAAAIGLWVLFSDEEDRAFSLWVALLNVYMVAAVILAFLDRSTHIFSYFYMFRPGALILLLTLLWIATRLLMPVWRKSGPEIPLALGAMLLAYIAPRSAEALYQASAGRASLGSMLSETETEMVSWIKQNTPSDAVVVLEPDLDTLYQGDAVPKWAGLERLMQRPTLVNFKFVPTAKADMLRWYKLLLWREALFKGSCEQFSEYPTDYLVTRTRQSVDALGACTTAVWEKDKYTLLEMRN